MIIEFKSKTKNTASIAYNYDNLQEKLCQYFILLIHLYMDNVNNV